MELYLIRHGIAQDRAVGLADADRALTSEGRHKLQGIGKRLRSLPLHFDRLLSSPLCRAWQTAELLHQMGLTPAIEPWDGLCPDQPIEGLLHRWDNPALQVDRLGLVGHEPDLSRWGEQLLWGDPIAESPQRRLELKKAGIMGIYVPQLSPKMLGTGQLFWLTPPRFLLI